MSWKDGVFRGIIIPILAVATAAMAQSASSSGAAAPPAQQSPPVMAQDLKAGQNLVEANDCIACHSVNGKMVGPSYDAVDKRYKGQPGTVDKLTAKIKLGGSGNWGTIPMTPHPNLTDAQLKQIVEWILSLDQQAAQPGAAVAQPGAAVAQPGSAVAPAAIQGSASRGEDLFTGRTAFRNRGPACISCHSVAGLSFPNGGTLGPDLTHTYEKLGPAGTEATMQTLFFPTMIPVYRDHQLVPQEQVDMVAYFKQTAAEAKPQAQWTTQILIVAAFVLGIIFVALTAFFWRNRVRSVRQALVARATGQGART